MCVCACARACAHVAFSSLCILDHSFNPANDLCVRDREVKSCWSLVCVCMKFNPAGGLCMCGIHFTLHFALKQVQVAGVWIECLCVCVTSIWFHSLVCAYVKSIKKV